MMEKFIFDGQDDPHILQRRHRQKIADAMMNPPTDIGSGLASVGNAIEYRQSRYPKAPGAAKPTMAQRFGNVFGMGGGLN